MSKTPAGPGEFVTEAYNLNDEVQLKGFYQKWAEDYDKQMINELGYASPRLIAECFQQNVSDLSTHVVDLGCGTGLCGHYLAEQGFTQLTGIDFSADMVQVAKARGCYVDVVVGDLNEPLAFADNQFGGAICAGTFTHGHVGANCLTEVFRVLKPGAILACTVHFELWKESGFAETFQTMEASGAIKEISRHADKYYDKGEPEGWFCIYQKV